MQEKALVKLDAAASRKSRQPDRVPGSISGYQWIKRDMNGNEIWILMVMDKKGYMIEYERIRS
jgi:hypothetical protein